MTAENKIDFSILTKADVPQGEFAKLCGVSRITVHLWCKGGHQPNRFIAPKVRLELQRIGNAVARKNLPLPKTVEFGPGHFEAVLTAVARSN